MKCIDSNPIWSFWSEDTVKLTIDQALRTLEWNAVDPASEEEKANDR